MADQDQSKDPSQEPDPATSPTTEQFNTLQKQVGELTSALTESQKRNDEILKGLHEKAQDAATLRKELDERDSKLKTLPSDEEIASMEDNPKKRAEWYMGLVQEAKKEAVSEAKAEIKGWTDQVVPWAATIQKTTDETRKMADPRFRDTGFQEWKTKLFPDSVISDEELIKAYQNDKGEIRTPESPGGGTSSAPEKPAATGEEDVMDTDEFKALFGDLKSEYAAEDKVMEARNAG